MAEQITVTGLVLMAGPIGDYDKRLVLLTRERGRISCFAPGALRPRSTLRAASNAFVFGEFTLRESRTSFTLEKVSVKNYFTELAMLQPGVYYGFYFLDLANYFGRENVDESDMINLLYVTLLALQKPEIPDPLIRRIFELRTMYIQGIYPQLFSCNLCGKQEGLTHYSQQAQGLVCQECLDKDPGGASERFFDRICLQEPALYALQYILGAPITRLYGFAVTQPVFEQLDEIISGWMKKQIDRPLKSLEVLDVMIGT